MLAVTWQGKRSIAVESRPRPHVTDPSDVVLRVTATAICGSDLHLYLGFMTGMQKGHILGHEFMGVIEEVGSGVKKHSVGERVVVCFDIACGSCYYCKHSMFTACDTTNSSKAQSALYGDCSAGFFGYSNMTGGYEGGQAEYVRVPFADMNCLTVPKGMPDLKVLLLSDILPTAWHGNECAEVAAGDNVAIWGAGPVGILAAHCAQARGAKQVILIDGEEYRLQFAKSKLPGIHTINYHKENVKQTLGKLLPLGAPDACIEAVGMHYTKSTLQAAELAVGLATDSADMLNEIFNCCRKGGRVGVIGAYAAYTNHLNIGAFMEKGLNMRAGQTPVQRYWHTLLEMVQKGRLDPTMVITHVKPLEDAAEMYKTFNAKADGCVKVVLIPPTARGVASPAGEEESRSTISALTDRVGQMLGMGQSTPAQHTGCPPGAAHATHAHAHAHGGAHIVGSSTGAVRSAGAAHTAGVASGATGSVAPAIAGGGEDPLSRSDVGSVV
ncbi:MAG: hypothetical protein WDW36_001824 [Sanguina aurantia]